MSLFSPGSYRTIVAVDVADSTDPRRTTLHKIAMHDGLHRVLRQAFDEADIPFDSCDVADRGDGALIFIPAQFPRSMVADRLLDRLHVGLLRHNMVHALEAHIHLRLAAHAGEVYFDRDGQVSESIEFAARILEADDAKKYQRASDAALVAIVSDGFYRDVVVNDPGSAPGSYRQIPVAVKRTRDIAWLRIFGPGEPPAGQSGVLPVCAPTDLDLLHDLLGDLTVPQIAGLATKAAGPGVPPVRHDETAFGAVRYLLDFNGDGDGFPPALALVESLVAEVDDELGAALMKWNDGQAERLGLDSTLREIRKAYAAAPPTTAAANSLYLEVAIEHDGVDPDRYLVSQWRKEHGAEWLTAPNETQVVYVDDLETAVDRLVVAAEAAWAACDGCEVVLEFILPRDLLTVPFDSWFKERDSAEPRPLSLDYLVVLRSLERMRAKHWHRVWRNRWRQFNEDPAHTAMFIPDAANHGRPYLLDIALRDTRYVGMALSGPPEAVPQPGDELSAALRSGLPMIVWSRTPEATPTTHEFVTRLEQTNGLADLPEAVLSARRSALVTETADGDRMGAVVLLWDDPYRVVAVDRLAPWQLERKPADER